MFLFDFRIDWWWGLPCGGHNLNYHFDTRHLAHDDVIKWKHFPRYWPFVRGIHRSPVNSSHKGQWRGALMFFFICAWINNRVNNREAGDFRRYRAHYDVTVIFKSLLPTWRLGTHRFIYGDQMVIWVAMSCQNSFDNDHQGDMSYQYFSNIAFPTKWSTYHDCAMTWKHFPNNWSCVTGTIG